MIDARAAVSARLRSTWLLLELESSLVELDLALRKRNVVATLVNEDEVRAALRYDLADACAARLVIPRNQAPIAHSVLLEGGWQPRPGRRTPGKKRYERSGLAVVASSSRRPRRRPPAMTAGRGRYGFDRLETQRAFTSARFGRLPAASGLGRRWKRTGAWRLRMFEAPLPLAAEVLARCAVATGRYERRTFAGFEIERGLRVFAVEKDSERYLRVLLDELAGHRGARVLEAGTGSGAIALALARARPDLEILATDVSAIALGWARRNRRRLRAGNVTFHRGRLLDPVPAALRGRVQLVAANLPCVPPILGAHQHRPGFQPRGTATGTGPDGLGLVRELIAQLPGVLLPGGSLVIQLFRRDQVPLLEAHLRAAGLHRVTSTDATDRDEAVLTARRRE